MMLYHKLLFILELLLPTHYYTFGTLLHTTFPHKHDDCPINQPPSIQMVCIQLPIPLVTINHTFASVWFGTRLLMSPILRLVHELHLASTTFLLYLHILILTAGCGVDDTTSLA